MPAERKASRRGRNLPQISDAELVVMKVVWEKAPVTANRVVEALEDQIHWKPKTVHTLLRRLAQKQALAFAWPSTRKAASTTSVRWWVPTSMPTRRAARFCGAFSTEKWLRSWPVFSNAKD